MKTAKKIFKVTMIILLALIVVGVIYVLAIAFSQKIDDNKLYSKKQEHTIQIYDCNYEQISVSPKSVQSYKEINANTVNAFLSIEDKNFFTHNGVNIKRIAGALINNIRNKKIAQGGSTITQQLIKNTHLSSDKTINRKIREIKLSFELENKYSKEEILTMYLNNIYFGNGIYGLGRASNYYFGKIPKDLSIAESAYLAAIVKAPSYYSRNHEKANLRKNLVLKEMYKDNKISSEELKSFTNQKIVFSANNSLHKSVINYIENECKKLDYTNSAVKVFTKLDKNLLETCNQIYKTTKSAMINIVIDNTMSDIVLFQTNKYIDLQKFKRQPGSIIKPILPYSLALEKNIISPTTIIEDKPCSFGSYSPKNYNNRYYGNISIRQALMYSSNIAAVKTLEYCNSIENIIDYARNFNIELSPNDNNLALALGGITYGVSPINIANAYTAFANGGNIRDCSIIQKIQDENENIIYEKQPYTKRVIREDTAFLMTNMLQSVAKGGTAKALSTLPYNVAAKTGTCGTENGNTDAWTIAYTKDHTFLSWCGNLDSSLMNQNITGGTIPCLATKQLIEQTYRTWHPASAEIPPSVINIDDEYYSVYNPPKDNNIPSTDYPTIMTNGNKVTITFIAQKNKCYIIFREDEKRRRYFVTQIFNTEGKIDIHDTVKKRGRYAYFLTDDINILNIGNIII